MRGPRCHGQTIVPCSAWGMAAFVSTSFFARQCEEQSLGSAAGLLLLVVFHVKRKQAKHLASRKLILHFRSKKTFSFALTGRILYQFSCWFWKAPERPAHQHPSTHAIQEMQTSQLTSGTHMICMHSLTFNTNDFVFLSETTFCF